MGIPLMSEFLAILYNMSRRFSSGGDRGKAPMYATSHGDNSSDDETASAIKQVAQILQSRFDHREEDIGPTSGISIETWSRRRRSVEIASALTKSHTISGGRVHDASWLKGGEPLKERCEMMTSRERE